MLHGHFALASCTSMLHCISSVHRLLLRIALLHCAEHCVALVHCLLDRLASLDCTLHGHCALATCTGMLLCIASMHRLLHCTGSLHCSVHCIALRLRLQVRCYFWCRGCNCCMGSAGQALPPIIHMHKRVTPLTQQRLIVIASYVSCTAEILARCRVGLRAAHWLAKPPQSWSQLAGRLTAR